MKMPFLLCGIVKERIFIVGSEAGSVSHRGSGSEKNSFGSTTLHIQQRTGTNYDSAYFVGQPQKLTQNVKQTLLGN
jgi:hypothetical protein